MPPELGSLRSNFAARSSLLTAHASERAAECGINSTEIETAIASGEVIEDDPNDKYGPSCLILGQTMTGRLLHMQVSYPTSIQVITVDEPSPTEWAAGFRTRKRK